MEAGPTVMRRLLLPATLLALTVASTAQAADTYTPGTEQDLRLRQAKFLGASKQYYSAIALLLQMQREGGDRFVPPPGFKEMLAEFQLAYGLHDEAEQAYGELPDESREPGESVRTQMELAKFEYQRGYLDLARARLERVRDEVPREQTLRWTTQYSTVLLAQGLFNEAIEVIDDIGGTIEEEMLLRYNLGVALINAGRLPEGRSALDRVGRTGGDSDLARALRDRANVTLGWHFLQKQLGGSAKPVLMRVRSEGPYANRALLGLGWAELAPEGRRQLRGNAVEDELAEQYSPYSSLGVLLRRGYLEDPYDRAGIRGFRRASVADEADEALRMALVPWVELMDRDPQDPAVQESWLAVPFALDRLGAHTQAVEYYEKAAARLEAAYKETLRAKRAVRGGRMVETIMVAQESEESGWSWELRDLPDAPETYYLQTLLAEHRFAETMKQYRDMRQIAEKLEAMSADFQSYGASYEASRDKPFNVLELISRARYNWNPEYENLRLELDMATGLAAPGTYAKPLDPLALDLELLLSDVPERFESTNITLLGLNQRLNSLLEPVRAAATRAAGRLRAMATEELDLQKEKIDDYLVETRFALARLYDSAIPDEDQDEFEIDDQGNPIRSLPLDRGEFEIDKSRPISDQLGKREPPPTTRAEEAEEAEYEVK